MVKDRERIRKERVFTTSESFDCRMRFKSFLIEFEGLFGVFGVPVDKVDFLTE